MLLNSIKEVAFYEKVFWTGFVQFLNFQKHQELILWVAILSCRWLFCLRNSSLFIYFLSFNCFWGLTRLSQGVMVPFGHQSYSICWCNPLYCFYVYVGQTSPVIPPSHFLLFSFNGIQRLMLQSVAYRFCKLVKSVYIIWNFGSVIN